MAVDKLMKRFARKYEPGSPKPKSDDCGQDGLALRALLLKAPK